MICVFRPLVFEKIVTIIARKPINHRDGQEGNETEVVYPSLVKIAGLLFGMQEHTRLP